MIRQSTVSLLVLGLGIAVAGCGSEDNQIEVTGTVNLNGTALTEGDIAFVPQDKKFGGVGGKIKDGKFSLNARPGKYKVEIRATRQVPGKTMPSAAGPGAPPEPVIESIIPRKYNEQTTLEANVSDDKTTFPFDLKSP